MADYLGLTMEQYDELLSKTAVSSLVSFEAVLDTYGSASEKFAVQNGQSNPRRTSLRTGSCTAP